MTFILLSVYNVCIKYLWHIKAILLPPVLGIIFIVKFEKMEIYGVAIFGHTIFGITIYGIVQYLQTIYCRFGEHCVENCDILLVNMSNLYQPLFT